MMQYFEDIEVGATERFGHYQVTAEAVAEFAGKFDPQPFHLSQEAAERTHFGRLSASGWHSCAMAMAMIVENMEGRGHAGLGAAGIDELRWLKPVYPGDTLRCETEILDKRPSASRPEMGIVRTRLAMFNQHDVMVMRYVSIGLVSTRPTA